MRDIWRPWQRQTISSGCCRRRGDPLRCSRQMSRRFAAVLLLMHRMLATPRALRSIGGWRSTSRLQSLTRLRGTCVVNVAKTELHRQLSCRLPAVSCQAVCPAAGAQNGAQHGGQGPNAGGCGHTERCFIRSWSAPEQELWSCQRACRAPAGLWPPLQALARTACRWTSRKVAAS